MASTVTRTQILQAIERGHRYAPDEWQAELLEIAMLPAVTRGMRAIPQNKSAYKTFKIHRVSNKAWGNGYVLEGWNDEGRTREEGFRHSAARAWNGVGREYYGARDIENLRMWADQPGAPMPEMRSLRVRVDAGEAYELSAIRTVKLVIR